MLETVFKMRELDLGCESEHGLSEEISDSDECDNEEIDRLFTSCEVVNETLANKNEYILHVTATCENDPNIALCLSDNSCSIYKLSNSEMAQIGSLTEHNDKIIDCKFSNGDSNLLYTGSSDGTIKLWDIRTPKKSVITFTDTTAENDESKSLSCFDVSSNDRILSAGTDLFLGDAFLLFWDTRNHNLLGGYWESHTDDITQVKFHPDNMNQLISGSTDGLINVYDLSQTSEDDALLDSLNTESSVEQLLWFNENGKDHISCITHVSDLQLWTLDGAEPYKHLTRADLAKGIKRKIEGYIYIASHQAQTSLLVLVGSNYEDGECIRGLLIKKAEVYPSVGFKENKQRVRCSWYNGNIDILLTGGEKGIVNVWRAKKL